MAIEDMLFHIGDIRHQIATEENSFLNHSAAVCKCKREVRSEVARLKRDGVSEEEIVEHPDFLYASGDLDKTKEAGNGVDQRVKRLKEELAQCEEEYKKQKDMVAAAAGGGRVMVDEFDEECSAMNDMNDEAHQERARDDDNVSLQSNDGSALLTPTDIPNTEQFD